MALSACIGLGWLLTSVGSYTLFIDELGAGALPLLYFVGAIVSAGVGAIDGAVLQRYALGQRLLLVGLATGFISIGLGILSWMAPNRATVFALPLSFELAFVFGGLMISATALHRFDLRQSKRLYGLASSGRWLAVAICGPLLAVFGKGIDPALLVVIGGISLAAAGIAARVAVGPAETAARPVTPERLGAQSIGMLGRDPLARSIVALTIAGVIILFVVEYILLDRAEAELSATDLPSLLAFLGGAQGVVVLLFLLLSGPILSRFGVRTGLLAMPAILGVVTVVLLLAAVGDAGRGTLIAAGVLYVLEPALRYGMTIPSKLLLYQPLPPEISFRVHGVVEGPLLAISTAVAAGLIAVFVVLDTGIDVVIAALLVVIVVLAPISIMAIRHYVRGLSAAVNRRQLGDGVTLGAEARDVLVQQLADPDPGRVLAAARMLDDIDADALDEWSPQLLESDHPDVRGVALRWAEQGRVNPPPETLQRMMHESKLPWIDRFKAGSVAFEQGQPWVLDTSRRLQATGDMAGIALLRSRAAEPPDSSARALEDALHSSDLERRRMAAEALALVAGPEDEALISQLLEDHDDAVRAQAVRALARLSSPELWHRAFDQIGDPTLYSPLGELINTHEGVRRAVSDRLVRSGSPRRDRIRLTRLAVRTGDARLQDDLLSLAGDSDQDLRLASLTELDRALFVANEDGATVLRSNLDAMRVRCDQLSGACADPSNQAPDLHRALREALTTERTALARGLALLGYRPEATSLAEAIDSGSDRQQARAIELLDQRLQPDDRNLLRAIEGRAPGRRNGTAPPLDPQAYRWVRLLAGQKSDDPGGTLSLSIVERVVALRATGIFAATSSSVLLDVAESMEEHLLETGQVLFSAGDPGERLFVVVEGAVDVVVGDKTLDQLRSGEAFGELSLLEDKARSATVIADGESVLLSLGAAAFQNLLIDQPEVSMAMLRYVARRLRDRTAAPEAN